MRRVGRIWSSAVLTVAAIALFLLPASAAVFIFRGSLVVPSGGTINDTNATASHCTNYDASQNLSSAEGFCVRSITGTANQVVASAATGAVTLSLPQSIATSSGVQFGSLGVGVAADGTIGDAKLTASLVFGGAGGAGGGTAEVYADASAGNLLLNVPTGKNIFFQTNQTSKAHVGSNGEWIAGSSTYGPTSATVAGRITGQSDGSTSGYVPPTYTAAGAITTNTMHCVSDTVTAGGVSTTVTLSGAAAFANANYTLVIEDETAFSVVTPTAQAAGSFSFASVNTRVYGFWACGI